MSCLKIYVEKLIYVYEVFLNIFYIFSKINILQVTSKTFSLIEFFRTTQRLLHSFNPCGEMVFYGSHEDSGRVGIPDSSNS